MTGSAGLDWMRQNKSKTSITPHLVFVTSRKHLLPDITVWDAISAQEGILQHFSNENNRASGEIDPNYSETKLMLTYAVEYISKQAVNHSGEYGPQVWVMRIALLMRCLAWTSL